MSGHSRWANIKHKKAKTDVKRGKVFTKLVKEIMVAAKMGGADIGGNPRLRAAVESAKAENLPGENIERAIKKGAGELEGINYEEGTYEGYGPGGVALIISFMTDNRNRTAGEVRHVLTHGGGNLGANGSVSWIFESKGLITLDISCDEEAVLEAALNAGAEDVIVNNDDKVYEVYTTPVDFNSVKNALSTAGFKPTLAQVTMIPKNTVRVEGKTAAQLLRVIGDLEDLDDVQNVYANFDMSTEDMEKAV